MKCPNDEIAPDESLDDLLSLRGKPFSDWKEERKYLREKWGEQGKKVDLTDEDAPSVEESETKENEQS
jgi:hypothetical protein